jgi:hypothetical protein
MSIERQLRQAYDRAASSEPGEAGACDRFLRRRARRGRAVGGATSIVLRIPDGWKVSELVNLVVPEPTAVLRRPQMGRKLASTRS